MGDGSVVEFSGKPIDHERSGSDPDDEGIGPQPREETVVIPAPPPQTNPGAIECQPGDQHHVHLGRVHRGCPGDRLGKPEAVTLPGGVEGVDGERTVVGGAGEQRGHP